MTNPRTPAQPLPDKAPDAWRIEWHSDQHPGGFVGFAGPYVRDVNDLDQPIDALHHAEPLYTLPNALRALALDEGLLQVLAQAMDTYGARDGMCRLAHAMENPPPPPPAEPVGDVIVLDRGGLHWKREEDGFWRVGLGLRTTWVDLVKDHGPVRIYVNEAARG